MPAIKQVDKRTTAERRRYMQAYHARRKGKIVADEQMSETMEAREAALHRPKIFQFANPEPCQYLRDNSGTKQWPERRDKYPETLEQTLLRVKGGDDDD